ncbi:histidine--tRNA ligase [Phenylobacterium sp. Root77]|jgi:histidyl-tRNA synthetase|uniref:histidine--tRNA ligase n=1 Tax=unclassified Phenylobacterium TaxID=2640670 RepID=UPI0006FB33A1|nr:MULTISPECIES: histidine--tRNA ligase [unclassified Phenylobacterium]KQW71045.1 histidine--tRNA ligase [Phenylobacterium sp. Root1277]KQW95797.1 histidine--tRNA ligase [Phenylobacterium sp. Root1290]KRC41582.1 histidine--tRNA ligase [Phenylobacterium sp. Root77]
MTDAPRPEARAPRGFNDRRARDLAAERQILAKVSAVYERYGFEAFDTGAFEYADALGKFLPDADRPNEGVFALQDDDEQWMALRYDLTAPLARFVAETKEGLPKPFRRYAFGTVWRNEKPGPGRFREFTQCDADTVGSARPEADAEIIAMAVEGLEAAGLPAGSAIIKVNNRKLLNGLLTTAGVQNDVQKLAVLRAVDKLDRLGPEGVRLLLGEGRKDESGDFTKGAGLNAAGAEAVLAFVGAGLSGRSETLDQIANIIGGSAEGDAGLAELAAIDKALTSLGVGVERAAFDPSIVRGLEYYTGAVFEAELLLKTKDEKGRGVRFGSIGGGGRYDDLVARFTGEQVPATGFSFGVSRLVSALRAAGRDLGDQVRGPVVVIAFTPDDMAHYFSVVGELRSAGIPAEVYLGSAGMKAQMKYADRRLAPAAIMLGGDEIAAGKVTIKDLDLGRALSSGVADNAEWREQRPGQQTINRADLVEAVRKIIEAGQ